ncbi:Gfo/Idh/MocA family oxidoreductase [Coxiella endosymbiont of Rhipicephalus microplus]
MYHAKLTREALEAGKDVCIKKPLVLQIEDAETLSNYLKK